MKLTIKRLLTVSTTTLVLLSSLSGPVMAAEIANQAAEQAAEAVLMTPEVDSAVVSEETTYATITNTVIKNYDTQIKDVTAKIFTLPENVEGAVELTTVDKVQPDVRVIESITTSDNRTFAKVAYFLIDSQQVTTGYIESNKLFTKEEATTKAMFTTEPVATVESEATAVSEEVATEESVVTEEETAVAEESVVSEEVVVESEVEASESSTETSESSVEEATEVAEEPVSETAKTFATEIKIEEVEYTTTVANPSAEMTNIPASYEGAEVVAIGADVVGPVQVSKIVTDSNEKLFAEITFNESQVAFIALDDLNGQAETKANAKYATQRSKVVTYYKTKFNTTKGEIRTLPATYKGSNLKAKTGDVMGEVTVYEIITDTLGKNFAKIRYKGNQYGFVLLSDLEANKANNDRGYYATTASKVTTYYKTTFLNTTTDIRNRPASFDRADLVTVSGNVMGEVTVYEIITDTFGDKYAKIRYRGNKYGIVPFNSLAAVKSSNPGGVFATTKTKEITYYKTQLANTTTEIRNRPWSFDRSDYVTVSGEVMGTVTVYELITDTLGNKFAKIRYKGNKYGIIDIKGIVDKTTPQVATVQPATAGATPKAESSISATSSSSNVSIYTSKKMNEKGYFSQSGWNINSLPGKLPGNKIVGSTGTYYNQELTILEDITMNNGTKWLKVQYAGSKIGYVDPTPVTKGVKEVAKVNPITAIGATLPSSPASSATKVSNADKVLAEAAKYLGTPYRWGGRSPGGFDCSGFVQYVFKQSLGIDPGTWTVPQEKSGPHIPVSQATPGDLLFWGSKGSTYHVAIYVGNNKYIHAPQTGDVVRYATISPYYYPSFAVDLN